MANNDPERPSSFVNSMPAFMKNASHPHICFWHLFFKFLALFFYMFFGMFASDKTLCYIFVITVCAFDFWVVKNVSGR